MTYPFPHIRPPSRDGSREQPGQAIELGGLDARRPDLGVLVAEEDMAVVGLNGADEGTGSEVGTGEAELSVAAAPTVVGEQDLVLEAAGSASDARIGVGEEAVEGVGDGDWRGRRGGIGECEGLLLVSVSAACHHALSLHAHRLLVRFIIISRSRKK